MQCVYPAVRLSNDNIHHYESQLIDDDIIDDVIVTSFFFLAAFRTQDVATVGKEATSKQQGPTFVADEAVSMPLSTIKCDKFSTVNSSDRFGTSFTFLGKQLTVTLDTVWLLTDRCKPLTSDNSLTVCTAETLAMPRSVVVHNASFNDRQATLGTSASVLMFVARYTDDVTATRYERICRDLFQTQFARETLSVPLSTTMFIFLHSGAKDFATFSAAWCKKMFVAGGAEQLILSVGERLVDQ